MIMESFSQFGEWTWITLGLALLGLELLAPGIFFMWLGIAAIAVGLVAFFNDMSWQVEVALFVVFAIASIIVGRRFFARQGDETTDTPGLNERGKSHLGREITLAEPLVGGTGRVKIGDTMWRIEGPDLPAGARVRVSAVRGALLEVEHVQPE
jgi:membrane protein implicated in regulation of membrane protease activity